MKAIVIASILLLSLVSSSSAILDYPLKCSWWTWGEWDRRNCLPLGHPACSREKRKEIRYRQVQWRPKYGQKPCSGKYVDYRPCICLSPDSAAFVTPPELKTVLAWIKHFLDKNVLQPVLKWGGLR